MNLMQFWTDAFDKNIVESHNSSEDNVRTEMWGNLKKKMHNAKYDAALLQSWLFASHEESFQEAYYMLEHLPVRISSMLSIEKLMWVKEKRKPTTILVSQTLRSYPLKHSLC